MQDERWHLGVIAVAAVLSFGGVAAAGQTPPPDRGAESTAPPLEQLPKSTPKAVPQPTAKTVVQRWFDVQAATLAMRYRKVESSTGLVTSDHLQDSLALRARVKLDKQARYTVNVGVATGSTFIGGWNNTGWGTGGPRVTSVYLKQLFLAASPAKGLDASYGGLALVRGESTEITTYDNDGYVVGSRVSVKRPKDIYLDDVSVTAGFLGDLKSPSFTDRYSRLDEINYFHVLAAKRFRGVLGVSTDYTRLSAIGTLRSAFNLKTPKARAIDFVRYEQYRRLDGAPAWGFAVYAEKALNKRVSAGGGYADIDARYGAANADRFNWGRRVFEQASVKVLRDLTASVFVTQAVNNSLAVSNNYRTDVIISYNALGPMQRAGYFK